MTIGIRVKAGGVAFALLIGASAAGEGASRIAPAAAALPVVPATAPAALAPRPPAGGARLLELPAGRGGPSGFTPGPLIVAPTASLMLERGKGMLLRLPRPAGSIFVADPTTVDFQAKSASLVYVFGKAAGETVLYAVDPAGRVLFAGRIAVVQNLSGVRDALARHLPGDVVDVSAAGGSITLSGTVLSASHAADAVAIASQYIDAKNGETVVNLLAVAAPAQVNLRVRIAEVDRTVLKQFGINWEGVVNAGRFAFGVMTQNPVIFGDMLNRNKLGVTHNNIGATIDALAQEGLITLLAQPNLTALSGETASFLAGGEFPVPVASTPGTGAPAITIEFKKFGVSLDFTPTILSGDRINLRVRPEVSQLTTSGGVQLQGFSVPGLTVRRAETTVELGSGETFVIAGLLQRSSDNSLSKVPGLGDIPVIGALMRSSRYRRQETELAIIVTPYLVRPLGDPAQAAAPTDGLVEPGDAARVFGGNFYKAQPAGRSTEGGKR